MLVVSDTSPLRALSAVDQVNLVHALYGEVLIPPAVHAELTIVVEGLPLFTVERCPFIVVRAPVDRATVDAIAAELNPGESEAIALALEVNAPALLIDEARGRRIAAHRGLRPIGVLGILAQARAARLIPAMKPLIETIRARTAFRIDPRLVQQALRDVGEE